MRYDVSDKLVHLTKGTGDDPSKHREEAIQTLRKILNEKRLIGGNGFIKGKHKCVCFSEAPISSLSHIIAQRDGTDGKPYKYQPYGLIFEKAWLFQKGGRPVIYGPDDEYELLPEVMRYRHVRFTLGERNIDFTWEREWRIQTDQLDITSNDVTIVVPDRHAKDTFAQFHGNEWHFIVLNDLGVKIERL